jgi:3-mercaptopyruvate sulfurtransferase SseA
MNPHGDISQGPVTNLEQAENVDFMIEHRNGTPNSENIFYCGAAMRTSEHIKLLAQIEDILAA